MRTVAAHVELVEVLRRFPCAENCDMCAFSGMSFNFGGAYYGEIFYEDLRVAASKYAETGIVSLEFHVMIATLMGSWEESLSACPVSGLLSAALRSEEQALTVSPAKTLKAVDALAKLGIFFVEVGRASNARIEEWGVPAVLNRTRRLAAPRRSATLDVVIGVCTKEDVASLTTAKPLAVANRSSRLELLALGQMPAAARTHRA